MPQNATRILLVDDHGDTRRVFAKALTRAGHKVTTAASAEEALELCKHSDGAFDLLISDIELPGRNGLELARELRQIWSIPMIAVSGWGQQRDVEAGLEAGYAEYLVKPINWQQLRDAIESVTR